jgi:hypothetical protein
MKGTQRRLGGISSGSRRLKLCLLERGKAGASKVFKQKQKMLLTENSSPCKNSFDKTLGVPKTASAGDTCQGL